MNLCSRTGCSNQLKTGKKYCSARCSAIAREEARQMSHDVASGTTSALERVIKRDNPIVYDYMLEDGMVEIPYPVETKTHGDMALSYDGKEEYRPDDMLSWEAIERMRKSGPVVFAMEMKRARLLAVFSDGRYVVESPDKELVEIATAGLRQVMPRIANDFTSAAFTWGVSFQEQVWERKTRYELGLSGSRSAGTAYVVPKVFASVNPRTVTKIFRDNGKFNGFQQEVIGSGSKAIIVKAHESLVIPYREEFRRLWGPSFLEPLYPIWITYERVLRAMIRYMDRMAVPITVGKAPSKGRTTPPGSSSSVNNLQYALSLAMSLAKSNAVAIPSDVDEDGNSLWSLEYLTADSRQQSFIDVLEFLTQEMLRAALSADRALSQSSGGVGSYNIGEIHAEASSSAAEMLLINFVYYINKYLMPYFATYNRGAKAPPIYMKTQPVTTREQQILMTLLQQGSGSPADQDFFNWVNWKGLAEVSNIPIVEEGDEFKPPKPVAPKPEATEKKPVVEDEADIEKGQKKALEGNFVAISSSDLVEAMREVVNQRPFELGVDDFDETMVKRDAGGRFAKKNSSSGLMALLSAGVSGIGNMASSVVDAIFSLFKAGDLEVAPEPVPSTRINIDNMLTEDYAGAGTKELKDSLLALKNAKSEDEIDQAIADVAKARGISVKEAKDGYAAVKRMERAFSLAQPELGSESPHWGSAAQLKFGEVVSLNVPSLYKADPAMYSIIHPTGGIVGPGSFDIAPAMRKVVDSKALENHATTHDASGFIYSTIGSGNGYNYAGGLWFNGLALSGQISGISFWSRMQEAYGKAKKLERGDFDESLVKRDEGGKFAKKDSPKLDANRMYAIREDLKKRVKAGELTQEEADDLLSLGKFSIDLKNRINSDEDVARLMKEEFGFTGKLNVVDDVNSESLILSVQKMLGGGAIAYYDQSTGNAYISRDTSQAIQDGNLVALETVAHEAMHAKQGGADRILGPGEVKIFNKIIDLAGVSPFESGKRVGHTEGINQLATLSRLSEMTGTAIKSGYLETASSMVSNSRFGGWSNATTYPTQTAYAANLVRDIAESENRPAKDVLSELHSNGDDYPYQSARISTVYSGWSWPTVNDYYKSSGRSYATGIEAIKAIVNE